MRVQVGVRGGPDAAVALDLLGPAQIDDRAYAELAEAAQVAVVEAAQVVGAE